MQYNFKSDNDRLTSPGATKAINTSIAINPATFGTWYEKHARVALGSYFAKDNISHPSFTYSPSYAEKFAPKIATEIEAQTTTETSSKKEYEKKSTGSSPITPFKSVTKIPRKKISHMEALVGSAIRGSGEQMGGLSADSAEKPEIAAPKVDLSLGQSQSTKVRVSPKMAAKIGPTQASFCGSSAPMAVKAQKGAIKTGPTPGKSGPKKGKGKSVHVKCKARRFYKHLCETFAGSKAITENSSEIVEANKHFRLERNHQGPKNFRASLLEKWLDDTVAPLTTAIPMSAERLAEGQVKFAKVKQILPLRIVDDSPNCSIENNYGLGTRDILHRRLFVMKSNAKICIAKVPEWSQKVRAAVNDGNSWRFFLSFLKRARDWSEFFPDEGDSNYDINWPIDFGPAEYYKVEAYFRSFNVAKPTPCDSSKIATIYRSSGEPTSHHESPHFAQLSDDSIKFNASLSEPDGIAKIIRPAVSTFAFKPNGKFSASLDFSANYSAYPDSMLNNSWVATKNSSIAKIKTSTLVSNPDSKSYCDNSITRDTDFEFGLRAFTLKRREHARKSNEYEAKTTSESIRTPRASSSLPEVLDQSDVGEEEQPTRSNTTSVSLSRIVSSSKPKSTTEPANFIIWPIQKSKTFRISTAKRMSKYGTSRSSPPDNRLAKAVTDSKISTSPKAIWVANNEESTVCPSKEKVLSPGSLGLSIASHFLSHQGAHHDEKMKGVHTTQSITQVSLNSESNFTEDITGSLIDQYIAGEFDSYHPAIAREGILYKEANTIFYDPRGLAEEDSFEVSNFEERILELYTTTSSSIPKDLDARNESKLCLPESSEEL